MIGSKEVIAGAVIIGLGYVALSGKAKGEGAAALKQAGFPTARAGTILGYPTTKKESEIMGETGETPITYVITQEAPTFPALNLPAISDITPKKTPEPPKKESDKGPHVVPVEERTETYAETWGFPWASTTPSKPTDTTPTKTKKELGFPTTQEEMAKEVVEKGYSPSLAEAMGISPELAAGGKTTSSKKAAAPTTAATTSAARRTQRIGATRTGFSISRAKKSTPRTYSWLH